MKKLLLTVVLFMATFCLFACAKGYEPEPHITEGEFPFVLEYEKNGERVLIEDTVVCSFDGHDITNPFPFIDHERSWYASLKSGDETKRVLIEFEPNTESVLTEGRINTESRVILYYGHGGYYLGDPTEKKRSPCINYTETYKISEKVSERVSTKLTHEQLEKHFGIKILRFEFSDPIENKFG